MLSATMLINPDVFNLTISKPQNYIIFIVLPGFRLNAFLGVYSSDGHLVVSAYSDNVSTDCQQQHTDHYQFINRLSS